MKRMQHIHRMTSVFLGLYFGYWSRTPVSTVSIMANCKSGGGGGGKEAIILCVCVYVGGGDRVVRVTEKRERY